MPATDVIPARGNGGRNHARGDRGRAGKRRGGGRSDRDGDLLMDVAASRGRGRVGKSSAPASPAMRPADLGSRTSRGGILSATAQRAILRQAATGDLSVKEPRGGAARGGLTELKVTGWDKSKASHAKDRGVSSLVEWLEKKASMRLGSGRRNVKIKKSHVEGNNVLTISVQEQDAPILLRMNNYGWAGITLKIERVGGEQNSDQPSSSAEKTKAILRGVLERRYNMEEKFLDLSALGHDEELKAQAIFDSKSTASKFFPAMMRVLELAFDTPQERDAAIESVSLANNDLTDLSAVTTLSQTLPKLHNLDLSNNKFQNLAALGNWRRRFLHLHHLILSNNPLEQADPNYGAEVVKWYPNLRMLNNVQVRTEEEVASKAKVAPIPFPIKSPIFQDEGGIAENFVRTFFNGFDTDRPSLAALYYDDHSSFSFAVNTAAPRDPAALEQTEKQEWEHYIKNSRNLKKITQLPARQHRLFRGAKAVADAFATIPKTKHPDLAADARKWLIEAHMQPGIPDPSGQSPSGVDGFCITVHGEYDELDPATNQPRKKRSFDHIIMLGPGGPSGVRIHTHELTIRAYGGTQAFEPDEQPHRPDSPHLGAATNDQTGAELPPGLTPEIAEQMVLQIQTQTAMTLQYSKDCLEQSGWDIARALEAFNRVKATLPPAAFVQQQTA